MMKRLSTIILATLLICSTSWANEEHNITFDRGKIDNDTSIVLPYGIVTLKLEKYASDYKAAISLENTAISEAAILFRQSQEEKSLKKNKPKIEFEKTFPGNKGYRRAIGCKDLKSHIIVVLPAEKSDLLGIDIRVKPTTRLELPIYLAKYNPKKLKKGKDNVDYKILSEELLVLNLELKGWDESDPEYVSTKNSVDEYLQTLKSVAFCKNKKHKPSLRDQQKPYQEKKDSLINVIETRLETHNEWYITDSAHIAYSELLNKLEQVNLNDHNYDCKKHGTTPPPPPTCAYCSLSPQEIYHQLDDLYQGVRTNKISRSEAIKRAKALNNCYHSHPKRKRDKFYTGKITEFYNRIVR